MSNGGWNPPQPGGAPPPQPGPGGPGTPPGGGFGPPPGATGWTPEAPQPVPLEPSGPPSRSRGKMIAAGVGVVAIVGAGVFAFTRISGDSASGGAGTPEEAGQQLVEAFGNEDVLGAVDVLLPGERETLRDPMTEFVDELRRMEVLSDDADLSSVGGVDIEVSDSSVDVDETNVDDIVNLRISIDATGSVNGEDLPIGDLILDNVDGDPSEADVEGEDASFELPVTAVEQDGRWYVSLFYTVAEQARQAADAGDIPAADEAIAPTGGDDPEDAFDAFLDGIAALDMEAMIASLNPNEFEALQRYAPLFLSDAQDALDEGGVDISIDEPQYTVSGDGDTRSMTVSYIAGEISAEGDTVGFELEDGCFTLTPPPDAGEPVDSCELTGGSTDMDEMFGEDAPAIEDFLGTLGDAFSDYENPGIIVKQVDGRWYLSPMATGADQMLAVMRALDRGEIEDIADEGGTLVDLIVGRVNDPFPDDFDIDDPIGPDDTLPDLTIPDDIEPDDTIGPDESTPDFTIPDLTIPDGTVPDDTTPDDSTPGGDGFGCYSEELAADALACFEATGDVEAAPAYIRLPECGLADAYWSGDYTMLPDAEFVAAAEEAAPCFQDALAAGTIDDLAMPLEMAHPECLEGRNWFEAYDDDEYYDRLLACASE